MKRSPFNNFALVGALLTAVAASAFAKPEPSAIDLEKHTLFYASFDRGLDADIARGQKTATQGQAIQTAPNTGVAVTPHSRALDLSHKGAWISYPAAGNIDLAGGTVAFWLQPKWKLDGHAFCMIFRVLFDEQNRGTLTKGTKNWKNELLYLCRLEGKQTLSWTQIESGRGAKADIAAWAPDTWHFVVAAWGNKKLTIYLDGQRISQNVYHMPKIKPIDLILGSPWWGHDAESLVDDLRILDTPLTPEQVTTLYNQALKDPAPAETALSAPDAQESQPGSIALSGNLDVFKPAKAPAAPPRSTYLDIKFPAAHLSKPIQVDGRLDDPGWKKIPEITGFILRGKNRPPQAQSFVRIAYDQNNLYFGVRMIDPKVDQLRADYNQHDQPVFGDDCFELLLNTQGAPETRYHIVTNSIGGIYDAKDGDKNWSGRNIHSAGRRSEGQWTVELAIPFKDLHISAPMAGEMWGLRLCRERHTEPENSSLPATADPFFSGKDLGRLIFLPRSGVDQPIQIQLSNGQFGLGLNAVSLQLHNTSDRPQKLRISATALSDDGMPQPVHTKQVEVLAGGKIKAEVNVPVLGDSIHAIAVRVVDEKGTLVLGRRLSPSFAPTKPSLDEIRRALPALQANAAALSDLGDPAAPSINASLALLRQKLETFQTELKAAIDQRALLPKDSWEQMRRTLAGFAQWRSRYQMVAWLADPWRSGAPNDPAPTRPDKMPQIVLRQAGNEREQIVLALRGMLVGQRMDARLFIDDFQKEGESGSFLSRDHLHIADMPYVQDSAGRIMTDPLVESAGHVLSLTPGHTEYLWVAFDSRGVAPGIYQSTITLKPIDPSAGKADWKTIPIRVTVWDFTLPETKDWPLSTFLFNGGLFKVDEVAEVKLLHDYHINWVMTNRRNYMFPIAKDGAALAKLPAGASRNTYFDPKLITANDPFLIEAHRLGMKVMFAWNSTRNPEWFKLMVAHLKSLGFTYDQFAFQGMSDEFRAKRIPELLPFHREMAKVDPKIQFMATLTSVPPPQGPTFEQLQEPAEYVKIWINHLPRVWPANSARAKKNDAFFRQHHRALWSYTCATQMQNQPVNSYYRMSPWRGYLGGMDGICYWTAISPKGDGWDHSDGYDEGLCYRGLNKTPVPTRRLESLREGLEDVAYMNILKSALEGAKDKISKKQRNQFHRLIDSIPMQLMGQPQTQTADIDRWRTAIAQAILKLQTK